jgi:hypothetical protein
MFGGASTSKKRQRAPALAAFVPLLRDYGAPSNTCRRHGAPWPARERLGLRRPAPLWFLPPGLPEHRQPPKEPP